MSGWVVILPSERDALLYLHSMDDAVFSYLAERTDWKTGQVGNVSAISYARMASDLSEDVPRKAKLRNRVLSRDDVRNSIGRMVKAGLLDRLTGKSKRLVLLRVFWSELLTADSSVQNPDTRQLPVLLRALNYVIGKDNNELGDYRKCSYHSKPDPVTTNHTTTTTTTTTGLDKFSMSMQWKCTREFLTDYLSSRMVDVKTIKNDWIIEYKAYWYSQQHVVKTQQQWDVHIANHLIRFARNPGHFESLNGLDAGRPSSAGSKTQSTKRVFIPKVPNALDDSLTAYAQKHGMPLPADGADYVQYRAVLRAHRDRMMDGKVMH